MADSDDYLKIDTPENVNFGYEVVGIGSRFIAALIDNLIIFSVLAVVGMVLFVSGSEQTGSILTAIGILISFAIFWGYYIFFEMRWNGRSPGKKLVGLRVIRQDGTPITLTESIIRNLVRIMDFLPTAYGVGIVTMFIDGQSRRLGDMIAGTVVIRDQESISLSSLNLNHRPLPAMRAPGAAESAAKTWPIHLLDDDDIRIAEDFLKRRDQLTNEHNVGLQITRKLMKKMEIPTSQIVFLSDAIYALDTVVREYRKRE